MFFRKKIKELESKVISLALELAEAKKGLAEARAEVAEIKVKLPDYESAVEKGVVEMWDKAVSSIVNYNPYAKPNDGGDR